MAPIPRHPWSLLAASLSNSTTRIILGSCALKSARRRSWELTCRRRIPLEGRQRRRSRTVLPSISQRKQWSRVRAEAHGQNRNLTKKSDSSSLRVQDDLAKHLALFQIFVGRADFSERKDSVHHRLQATREYMTQDLMQLRHRPHIRAEQG